MMDIRNIGRNILQIQQCFVLLFFLVASSMDIFAQTRDLDMSRELPLDTLVRFGRLENGFTYYLRKNDSLERRVRMTLVVNAGSANENPDQLEYAHLLEHLGANATKHFPVLHDYFRRDGRKSHANTGPIYTKYYIDIGTEDPEVIKKGLLALRDQAHDISLDQELIDVQRGAVLGEMRTNDPYQTWVFGTIRKYCSKNFTDSKSAKANIEKFDRNAFVQFYEDWYQPQHQAAIIVGDIQLDSMEQEVKKLFSDLKNKEKSVNASIAIKGHAAQMDGNNRYVNVLDTIQKETKLYVVTNRTNYRYAPKTRSDYRKRLLQELYAKIMAKRSFYVTQKQTAGISEFTSSYLGRDDEFRRTLIMVDLDTKNGVPIKEQFLEAMAVRKSMHLGITEDELQWAKNEVGLEYSEAYMGTNQNLTNQYSKHFILAAPYLSAVDKSTLISQQLEDIQLKELQDVALDFADLSSNSSFIFFRSPDIAEISPDEMKRWTGLVSEMSVAPMDVPSDIRSVVAEADIPSQDPLDIRQRSEDMVGVTNLVLENGVRVILKPSLPFLPVYDRITVHAFRPDRVHMAEGKDYMVVKEVQSLMTFLGAGTYTNLELENFKRNNQIRLQYGLKGGSQLIHGESKPTKIKELLALMYLYMKEPVLDEKGFEAWSRHLWEGWNGTQIREGSNFYDDRLEQLWYPRMSYLTQNGLKGLNQKKILKYYKKWFGGIDGYTFVITGNFDTERMIDLLRNTLSGFPLQKQEEGKRNDFRFPLKPMEQELVAKNIDQAYVRLYFPVVAPRDPKTKAMLAMVSKYFEKRAWARLRQGCYSPGIGGKWMDEQQGVFAFWVRFDSELGNQDKLIQYALEEFRKVKENGVDPEWLESALQDEIASYGKGFEYFKIFNFWTDYLQQKLILDEDFATEALQYEALLEHFIDVKDVNEAAKTYMQEDYYQQFILLPEHYSPSK